MKIQKLGHCCLLLEVNNKRILVDPGNYTIDQQTKLKDIDIILITHEHADHFHIESLKEIVANNPRAKVVTNTAVNSLLKTESIGAIVIEDSQAETIDTIVIEGYGSSHEPIYKEFGKVQNTGYFINNTFFFPGDSFTNPGKSVEILALPINAPWCKISESINYLLEINPKIAFPVHDGNMVSHGFVDRVMKYALENKEVKYSKPDERGVINY